MLNKRGFCYCLHFLFCYGIVVMPNAQFFQPYVQSKSECASAHPTPTKHSARAAILVRGDSFRNWNAQYVNTSCCMTTRFTQKLVVDSHLRFANHLVEKYGIFTTFFISTYACTNGKDYVERLLPQLYGSENVGDMVVLNRSATSTQYKGGSQWDVRVGSAGRAVSLLRDYLIKHAETFDHIFSIRFDTFFPVQNYSECAFPLQVLRALRPVSTKEFVVHSRDEVLYLPGHFLECWWYQLSNPIKYSKYQSGFMFDVTLKLSGMNRTLGAMLPTHGLQPFSFYKMTPQTLAIKTTKPNIGPDCMCGKWLLTLDASNTRQVHMDADGKVNEYTARGSSTRTCKWFSDG
jgi:hypothetical protein